MREGLDLLGQGRIQHRTLPVDQFVDAPGQGGPMRLGQIEVAAQVEQGGLLDGVAHSGAVHQAVGHIGLARDAIAGLGAANEHAGDVARKTERRAVRIKSLWHYISQPKPHSNADNELRLADAKTQRQIDKVRLGPTRGKSILREELPPRPHSWPCNRQLAIRHR